MLSRKSFKDEGTSLYVWDFGVDPATAPATNQSEVNSHDASMRTVFGSKTFAKCSASAEI